jgi:hypothetical protein
MEVKRGGECLPHAPSDLGGLLVPRYGSRELLLDRLDVTVQLHRDITMTS